MANLYVTGSLTPDATGTYTEDGTYNGQPYHTRSGAYYIFWDGAAWRLCDASPPGASFGYGWKKTGAGGSSGTYSPDPAGMMGEPTGDAVVSSTSAITEAVSPVVATWTVAKVPIRVIVAPVVATWSVVSLDRIVQPAAIAATWSVVQPVTIKRHPVDPVTANWTPVAPTTAQTRTIAVSPVVATWSIPSLGGTVEAVSPVAATWSVPFPTLRRSVDVDPVVATWSVVQPEKRVFPDPLILTITPVAPQLFRGKYFLDCRGLFRIFNAAGYRFYRSNVAPPAEGSSVWATAASLPNTPADVFADGTWWISASYFNGVLDSGFLALGSKGETYRKLVISGGVASADPPQAPIAWHLERQAGGVVRIIAVAYAAVASEWTVGYTDDGSDPAEDSSDVTATLAAGMSVWEHDLPAADHGDTVKVRVQVRRNDGTVGVPVWVYSDGSAIQSVTADATGPTAPVAAERSERPAVEV